MTTSLKLLKKKRTRLQSKNAFWFRQRQHRITASTFGTFCRLKNSTDPLKTFEQKRSFFTSQSVRHGIQYEDVASALFLEINKCDECPVGLIVNYQIPFLGASPDRLIIENGEIKLLEVKRPYSVFQKKVQATKGNRFKQILYKKGQCWEIFYVRQAWLLLSDPGTASYHWYIWMYINCFCATKGYYHCAC